MTADEDQLRALFGDLAQRQPVRGTDAAFLQPLRRRRQLRLGAVGLSLVLVAGVGVAAAVQLPGGDGQATVATDPTPAPTTTPTELPTLEPVPSASPLPPAPVPPRLTGTTGTKLVIVQATRLELLDVDSGERTLLTTDQRLLGNRYDRIDVLSVDGQLVMLGDNNTGAGSGPYDVFSTTAGPGSPLRIIGQASGVSRSDNPGRVWLDPHNFEEPGALLIEVDLKGRVRQRIAFSHGWNAQPFGGDFLRTTESPDGMSGSDTEHVNASGKVLHRYSGEVMASNGHTALLVDRMCKRDCEITALTVGATITSRSQTFASLPYLTESAISNDGTRLFVNNILNEFSNGPAPGGITELDLTNGQQRRIEDAWTAPYWGASIRFSSDGRWMFFADASGKSVDAHDLTTHRSYRVPGTFKTITQLESFG